MGKIVCVGELLVDMIGDETGSLKENIGFSRRAGGAPANVAVAASRLGAEVEKVATVGEDEFGEFLVEKLEEEGVGTSRIRRSDLKTTLAFASLDKEAKPHFSFYRGADEKITQEQLQLGLDEDDTVHLGSLPFTDERTAENLIEFARETDATVSFDPNLRDDLMDEDYRERMHRVVEHVDVMIAAEEELEFFQTDLGWKLEELVVTRGDKGADLYSDKTVSVEAPDVDVVDTTGAGDALTGAYLAFRSQGRERALRKAVQAASISTTSKGAMAALPTQDDLG